jgi:hypothetical protein
MFYSSKFQYIIYDAHGFCSRPNADNPPRSSELARIIMEIRPTAQLDVCVYINPRCRRELIEEAESGSISRISIITDAMLNSANRDSYGSYLSVVSS